MKPEQFNQAVAEFKQIYKEEYGLELSTQEASNKALSLLQLFDILTTDEKRSLQ